MLKVIATGTLIKDVELKYMNDSMPMAYMPIESERRYRGKDGKKYKDLITVRVRGQLAERCASIGKKGARLLVSGDLENSGPYDDPDRSPGYLIKADQVDFIRTEANEAMDEHYELREG